MNKLKSKWGAALLSIIVAVIAVVSCSREELTKDLNLYVGTDFLVNPITLQIADANEANQIPSDVTVSIEGRDKNKIFSLLGEKNLTPISGIIALAVKKIDAPTAENPLDFTIVLSAPNYVTKRIRYRLNEITAPLQDIEMININTPPQGVSIARNSFISTAATGTTEGVKIASPLTQGKIELSEVAIQPSTMLLTEAGEVLSGNVQSTLVHSNAKSVQAVSEIPGWATAVKIENTNGQLYESVIEPVGFFELKMTVGNKRVEKFSKALTSVSYIDASTFNPIKGRKVQAGDSLNIFSLSEGNDAWKEEGFAVLERADNGKFKISFPLPHLSHFVYCFGGKYCWTRIRVSSTIPNSAPGVGNCRMPQRQYFYRVFDASNPHKVYATGWSDLSNGSYLEDCAFLTSTDVRVSIHEFKQGPAIYTSATFNPCSRPLCIIPDGRLPKDNSVLVRVNVSALCGGGSITSTYIPSVSVLYRDMTLPNSQWAHLVTLVPNNRTGTGCARGLVEGKRYDFAIAIRENGKDQLMTFSKCLKQPNGLLIPRGDTTIKVESPYWNYYQTLEIKRTPGTNLFDINYPNYPLPKNMCDEIDNRFSAFVKKR